jgi:hypothetical protein
MMSYETVAAAGAAWLAARIFRQTALFAGHRKTQQNKPRQRYRAMQDISQ